MATTWLTVLKREVVACGRCPRLVAYREEVARVKRRPYLSMNTGASRVRLVRRSADWLI